MMMDERHNQTVAQLMREFGSHIQAQNGPRPQQSRLNDFQRTHPPTFSIAADPLEADDWLRTMDKKLEIARVQEQDKAAYLERREYGQQKYELLEGPRLATLFYVRLKQLIKLFSPEPLEFGIAM